jgi:hypothetical protein
MSADGGRRARQIGEDIIVALNRLAELFSVTPGAMLERDARLEPGADEIVNELLGRSRLQRRARIVVTLPPEQITNGIAETLQAALSRYCAARLARVQRETEMAWRQGLRSLGSGSILFVVGLLLSTGFLEPDVPQFWQDLLGNGVFLVIGGRSVVSARPAVLRQAAAETRGADSRGDQPDATCGATRRRTVSDRSFLGQGGWRHG